jgi:ubiquitin-conjugating enzyme E2 H
MMSDFEVLRPDESQYEFIVRFHGPEGSEWCAVWAREGLPLLADAGVAAPYEGGVWLVRVSLPAQYPFKSPSVGFCNRMTHPNVCERSGSICLDVLNSTWTPMYGKLPGRPRWCIVRATVGAQTWSMCSPRCSLSCCGTPTPLVSIVRACVGPGTDGVTCADPLNGDAATLLVQAPDRYTARVKETIDSFANETYICRLLGALRSGDEAAIAAATKTPLRHMAASSSSSSSSSSKALSEDVPTVLSPSPFRSDSVDWGEDGGWSDCEGVDDGGIDEVASVMSE